MKGTPLTAWRVCCRRVIRSALTTSVDVGTHQIDSINDLNPLGRSHLRQWYGYYQGEVPEGGPFGEGGAVLTDRELREAILSRLIPYVLRDDVLSD